MSIRKRIIEGTWNCSSCGTQRIRGRHRRCPTCNNPREETGSESQFDFGPADPNTGRSLRESVTDPKALKAAQAGVDWFCGYCGASNLGSAPRCSNCRAERAADSRVLGTGAGFSPVADTQGSPSAWRSMLEALADRWERAQRGALGTPLHGLGNSPWIVGLVVVGLAVVGIGLARALWNERQFQVEGKVVGLEWRRVLHRDTFVKTAKREWRDRLTLQPAKMPMDGHGEVAGVEAIRDCERLQRGTRRTHVGDEKVCTTRSRTVECGTREVCTRKDLGNGFSEESCKDVTQHCSESYEDCNQEPRYVEEPDYAEQCTYDTWEWREVENREARGGDEAARWPEQQFLLIGPLDRLRREEQYTAHIWFELDGKARTHALRLGQEAKLRAFHKGQTVPLNVRKNGEVLGLAGQPP